AQPCRFSTHEMHAKQHDAEPSHQDEDLLIGETDEIIVAGWTYREIRGSDRVAAHFRHKNLADHYSELRFELSQSTEGAQAENDAIALVARTFTIEISRDRFLRKGRGGKHGDEERRQCERGVARCMIDDVMKQSAKTCCDHDRAFRIRTPKASLWSSRCCCSKVVTGVIRAPCVRTDAQLTL